MSTVKLQLCVATPGDRDGEQVSGLGPALGEPHPPAGPVRRTAPGRPWDHVTPWWLPPGAVVQRLARSAADHGIGVDVAVSLVIERSMCVSDLAEIFTSAATIVAALDNLASRVRPTGPVSGAAAIYLRQLAASDTPCSNPPTRPTSVCLPVRVAGRLRAGHDQEVSALLDGDLDLALAWERAAVLHGRTIAEWAMWQTLGLRALRGAPLG